MTEANTNPTPPEELVLSLATHAELIRHIHLGPSIGQRALEELIVSEGNSAELAGQLTSDQETQTPYI